jgi:hypothetical protein
VDTGKTSLLDSIAFVLGRDVEFHGAVARELRAVEIKVQIGTAEYTLVRRQSSKSTVTVLDATGTLEGKYPIQRRGDQQSLSSWLAEQMGLEEALTAVRLPGNRGVLTFAEGLLPFCYLTQDDIDRQIIMPSRADQTRITMFKLLMNLTTADYERIAGEIRDVANELKRRRSAAEAIGQFLDAEPATNLQLLEARIAELDLSRQAAARRADEAHRVVASVEQQDKYYEKLLAEAGRRWSDAEVSLDKVSRAYEKAQLRVTSCQEALASLTEMEMRPEWEPGTIKVVVKHCQYCGGEVPRGPLEPGQCFMCGGLRCGVIQPGERASLTAALASAQEVLRDLQPQYRTALDAVDKAKAHVYGLRKQRDERTRFPVPHVGAIADAEKELGAITGELEALRSARASAARVINMWEEIQQLEREQVKREERHALDSRDLTPVSTLVHDLQLILKRIMDKVQLPHWTGRAWINPETFLPVIDGMAFRQRGGGARSAVSIAYSLSLLTYALENASTTLPALLMIDSPRKNFGASASDQGLSDRLYEQILDYLKSWSGARGASRSPFQIIIADNDRRADKNRNRAQGRRDGVLYHPFTTEAGFIRDLKDPHAPFVAHQEDLFPNE